MSVQNNSIQFRVVGNNMECDLRLADSMSFAEFSTEIGSLLSDSDPTQVLRVSLLPPIAHGLSIRIAFKAIVNAWNSLEPSRRSPVECLVASEAVIDVLAPLLPADNREELSFQIKSHRLSIIASDIVSVRADAIVNASNTKLWLGGGVSHAIREACGPRLQAEMFAAVSRSELNDGDAVVTGSHGLLSAPYIIHAASAAGDEATVRLSIRNVLRLSVEYKFRVIAMPALGTGTGGMPMTLFTRLIAEEFRRHARANEAYPELLRLVLFRQSDAATVVTSLKGDLLGNVSE